MKKQVLALLAAILLVVGVALVACNPQQQELTAPQITLDGNVISWAAVDGAEKYVVIINGEEFETTQTTYTITATSAGDYDVYVTAVKGETRKTSQKVTYTIEAELSAPIITLSGNVVSWSAVEHATSYKVFVNGSEKSTVTETRFVVEETAVGEYKITVKACNATKQSVASNQVVYTVEEPEPEPTQLATPENVQIVGNRITWNAVENAAGYEVYVNGTRAATVATTEYVCVERETGSYEITIVSVNSPNYLASEPSASVNYTVEEFDISKPVLATTEYKNVVYCAQICEDGYLRIQPMSEITDFTKYMWYLEPDGTGMYNIKLWNGLYLGYSDVGASDASETIQTALNGTHTQWKVVNTSSNNYKLFNVAHAERWDSAFTWCYFYGVKTNDAGTHDVLKFGDNCSTWVFGNLDIPFVEPQILDAPVVSLSGATASWPAVEHATAYEVYVEGEKVSTQQETSYTATACGKIRVVAIDETHEYLPSVLSNTVYFVDYSSPVALYETSHNNLLTINGDGLLVEGVSKNESLADYSAYAMQLIAVGDYYKIKLANGMYLQHTKIADTDRFVAAYVADVDSQLFKIVVREDGYFNLYPKDNEGYVICTDNNGSYNQYNDANYNGAIFVFVNVQATIAEDAQQPIEETFSFQLPVYPVYKTNNDELLTIGIASDGIITMVAVADVTDFSQHMMYLEKVEDTEYYKIKLYNGKYLTRVDGGGSGPEAAAMALITSGDTTTQQWKFVASEGGYKMQNLSHINQWGDYYYGEWYGVFKFGACNPWILENKDIPFVEPEEPTLDLSKPIVTYETSHNNLLTINGDGLLVEGVSKNESIADYSAYAMQLIAVGDYYKIKLANGMYLQHTKISDTDRFVAAYVADVDSQLFKIVVREDGNFNLYPKTNEGYVICTDNNGGYNQYNDANYGGAIFVFVNVQATIAEDAVGD